MQTLSQTQITEALERASRSDRRRAIMHISCGADTPMQLFGNALLRGTYAQPHRHAPREDRDGVEHFVLLQGEVGVITFHDDGSVLKVVVLSTDGVRAVSIPAGVWHTIVCLSDTAVVIEVKLGYYDGATDKEFHPEYPAEGKQSDDLVSLFERIFSNSTN